jgi:hypothetical protein
MFSNRFFYPRIAILLALILGGFVYSHKTGKFINPAFWICQLQPDRFNNKELWVPYTVIEKIENSTFIINTDRHKITVVGRTSFKEGERVALTGKFIADKNGGKIILEKIRKLRENRLYVSLISIAILIIVLFLFVSDFKPRWRGLIVIRNKT